MLKTPEFWGKRRGLFSELLLPFSLIPFLFNRLRERITASILLPVPVICVGNATAGGTGKTPVTIAIAELLKKEKVSYAFISRGYKGSLRQPTQVNPAVHSALETGDEPLLLAQHGPCWVGKNRLGTCRAAIAAGAKFLILDDGLQDPSITKTLSLLIIDGAYGFGNRLLIPAGPLRDRLDLTFLKTDAIVMVGNDTRNVLKDCPKTTVALRAQLQPAQPKNFQTNTPYVAFAGIGRPQKFFDTLNALGATLAENKHFPDHHFYHKKDLDYLERLAKKHGALLITTEKDAVRLPRDFRAKVTTLPVAITWEKPGDIKKLLHTLIARRLR